MPERFNWSTALSRLQFARVYRYISQGHIYASLPYHPFSFMTSEAPQLAVGNVMEPQVQVGVNMHMLKWLLEGKGNLL